MASVERDPRTKNNTWRVQYRKPDGKLTSKAGFRTKRDAQAFAETTEVSKRQGSYIAPQDAQVTLGELGTDWLVTHQSAVKPSTFHSDESAWRIHVNPKWGTRRIGSIKHTEVAAWVAALASDKSPTTVKRAHGVLASILDGAVRDRRLISNPAREVKTPKKTRKSKPYLTHVQVERLAVASKYPDFIRFLAYTGLRWGEATGLKVKHVDTNRRRVMIEENAVIVNGHIHVGTPKTHERRMVPYPEFLDNSVLERCKGKGTESLLWPANEGGYLRPGNMASGWFAAAVKRARDQGKDAVQSSALEHYRDVPLMPKVTPHDLRHTAASLAISAGANVKAVQRMLGHASAAMTLDTYADLFDDDLDEVAVALSRHRESAMQNLIPK